MGVGLDMFIRDIAALVASFKGIPEKPGPPDGALSTARLLTVDGLLPFLPTVEDCPLRRTVKHERQYTGLPCLGRNGTVADLPQSWQTARCRGRLAGRACAGVERYVMLERTS